LVRVDLEAVSLGNLASEPPRDQKGVTDRTIARVCRQMDFWYERVESFGKRLQKSDERLALGLARGPGDKERHTCLKNKWVALRSKVPPSAVESSRIGDSYQWFVTRLYGSARPDLEEWLSSYLEQKRIREFVPVLSKTSERRRAKFCEWCRLEFVTPSVVSCCPQCRRPAASPPSVKGKGRGRGGRRGGAPERR